MKKLKVFAFASAIALLSAGFQACASDDEATDAPVLTGEVVKTQLAISVPQSSSAAARTRMGADPTQADQQFNGIDQLYIFPMATTNKVDGEYVVGDGDDETFIGLRLESNAISSIGVANDHWIDAEIPVGVDNMLIYGVATAPTGSTGKFANGSLTATWDDGTISTHSPKDNIKFDLEAIQPSMDVTSLSSDATALALLALLNAVASAQDDAGNKWSSLAADYPQQNLLAPLYTEYIKLTAASSESIRLMLEDLYNSVDAFSSNDLSPKIKEAITATYTSGSTTIKLNATNNGTSDDLAWASDPNFPGSLNVPDGAVAVKFDTETKQFAFSDTSNDGMEVTPINKYVYPAQLYYFANSPIRVANDSKKAKVNTATGDTEAEKWTDFLSNYADENRVVTATTQSVAVKNQIEYGVANLQTKVKIGSGVIKDSKDNAIDLASGLTWTGVLVGGQKGVDWKFEPVAANTDMTIYDQDIQGTPAVSTTLSATPNYTLVLQTVPSESGDDVKGVVTIALEFKNTSGHDFFGINSQLIPAGGTFYLLAKLSPKEDVDDKVSGVANTGNRVFMQDYVTEAELTITSLAKAYNVIPDLRTPQLELGMSVNLDWKAGIKFTQNFE